MLDKCVCLTLSVLQLDPYNVITLGRFAYFKHRYCGAAVLSALFDRERDRGRERDVSFAGF